MILIHLSAAFAAGATIFAAANLILRAGSQRIRLLAFSVSLLTLCQIGAVASRLVGADSPNLLRSLDLLELTAGALSLSVVHLLNRENRERVDIEARLRVLEPLNASNALLRMAEHTGESRKWADQRKSVRYRMHAESHLRLAGDKDVLIPCELRDISQSGVGLMVTQPLDLHALVEVSLLGRYIEARVARCQPAGLEFSLGLTFASNLSRDMVFDIVRRSHFGAQTARV